MPKEKVFRVFIPHDEYYFLLEILARLVKGKQVEELNVNLLRLLQEVILDATIFEQS